MADRRSSIGASSVAGSVSAERKLRGDQVVSLFSHSREGLRILETRGRDLRGRCETACNALDDFNPSTEPLSSLARFLPIRSRCLLDVMAQGADTDLFTCRSADSEDIKWLESLGVCNLVPFMRLRRDLLPILHIDNIDEFERAKLTWSTRREHLTILLDAVEVTVKLAEDAIDREDQVGDGTSSSD